MGVLKNVAILTTKLQIGCVPRVNQCNKLTHADKNSGELKKTLIFLGN